MSGSAGGKRRETPRFGRWSHRPPRPEPGDGVLAHADKSAGLADATALGDMGEEGKNFVLRQVGVRQGSAFSLGKPGLAGLAKEQAALLGTVVSAHSEVAVAAFAVVQTIRILAVEECEVIHDKGWFHVVQG